MGPIAEKPPLLPDPAPSPPATGLVGSGGWERGGLPFSAVAEGVEVVVFARLAYGRLSVVLALFHQADLQVAAALAPADRAFTPNVLYLSSWRLTMCL